MTRPSADERREMESVATRLTEELSRPNGQPREAANRIDRWLIDHQVDREDREEILREVMMTGSVPVETQEAYITDMITGRIGTDGPVPDGRMMRQFRDNVDWARDQAKSIIDKAMQAQRNERNDTAEWAREELDEEQTVMIRAVAAALETNAMVGRDDEWTEREAAGIATDIVGLIAVENSCGFVGHCWDAGWIITLAQETIEKETADMEEEILRAMENPQPNSGVRLTITAMCMSHINDAIVEMEETTDETRRKTALDTASKWLEVHRNLPMG